MAMKWPWVSRRAYEDACAQRDAARLEATARGDALETLTREVYRDMLQLRREGFTPPAEMVEFRDDTKRLPERVRHAIARRAFTESSKAELRAWAWAQMGTMADELIAERILNGIAGEEP